MKGRPPAGFLLLTSGAVVFIVLPPDGQKLSGKCRSRCAYAVWLGGEKIMASRNHPESIASDAARGVGWTSMATRCEVSSALGLSQIARSATIVSAQGPGEPKRKS